MVTHVKKKGPPNYCEFFTGLLFSGCFSKFWKPFSCDGQTDGRTQDRRGCYSPSRLPTKKMLFYDRNLKPVFFFWLLIMELYTCQKNKKKEVPLIFVWKKFKWKPSGCDRQTDGQTDTIKACAALHLLTESPPPFLRLLLSDSLHGMTRLSRMSWCALELFWCWLKTYFLSL